MEAKQTAEVFEEFVASFEESDSSGKAFVRGSTSIKPAAVGECLNGVSLLGMVGENSTSVCFVKVPLPPL
jgi:hypothetical protein